MYIFITGGKTMGHITPLLTLYDSLKDKYKIIYFGLENSMEEEVCNKLKIPFYKLKLLPFYRKKIFRNFNTFKLIFKEKNMIVKEFKNYNIKGIISSGGYVSIPLLLAFSSNKIVKKILLEPNISLGLANKFLLNISDCLCSGYDTIDGSKIKHTGTPIKIKENSFDDYFFHLNKPLILFVGGSNGALEIIKMAKDFNESYPNVNIFVLTGEKYYETYKFNSNAKVFKNINNLSSVFKKFTLIISRAGALTITEILHEAIPMILLPSENVTGNHQVLNAKYFNDNGLALSFQKYDKSCSIKIFEFFSDKDKLNTMRDKQKNFIKKDAVKNIIEILEGINNV